MWSSPVKLSNKYSRGTRVIVLTRSCSVSSFVNEQPLLRQDGWQIRIRKDCRGRHRMVVGFTTTYAISAYHH